MEGLNLRFRLGWDKRGNFLWFALGVGFECCGFFLGWGSGLKIWRERE